MGFGIVFAFVTILCSSFYITFINSCSRSTKNWQDTGTLDYYDANSEQHIICRWHEMVKTPLYEATSLERLQNEARDETGKPGSRMYEYLLRAMDLNRSVPGLTRAECLVVLMYTDDSDARAFYREYNKVSKNRNWEPYRVYTAILLSALGKLSEIDPIPRDAIIYRGINFRPKPPNTDRIFWKAFTSASLDIKVAEEFATSDGTLLVFNPPASRHAARIRKLSNYYDEDEVLLLPFEAFNYWYPTAYPNQLPMFHFCSSETPLDCYLPSKYTLAETHPHRP